jgi:hypothetical protein
MVIYYSTKPMEMKFSDYDENQNIDTTSIFQTFGQYFVEYWDGSDSGKTLGVILSNEPTVKFHLIYLDDGGIFQKTYGVTTIEIDRGAGQKKCGNCHRFGFGGQSIDPVSG